MAELPDYDEGGRGHMVRSRWTWISVFLLLVGFALIGWGIIVTSWTPAVIGIAVFVVGAGAAVYGGLLYNVDSSPSAGGELHDVVHGEEHEGPDPG